MTTTLSAHHPNSQRGVALIVSMVMLVAITLIGIFVMSNSRLEWLMTNNSHSQTDAYRNAEIALARGLSPLALSAPTAPPLPDPTIVSNWNSGPLATAATPVINSGAVIGQYIVENLGRHAYDATNAFIGTPNPCTNNPNTASYQMCANTYRVWALGTDSKGAARILQATRTVPEISIPAWTNRTEIQ